MASHTAAHYFLEGLVDLGIDYMFSNFGTDHVSLIEALADWDHNGRPHPRVVICPHENVAVHMAGGYAAVTGKGQVVVVHVDAGTANASMGMHNLSRGRTPVFLMAGKAPYSLRGELPGSRDNYVHFVQDPFDIASLVRSYVKWEYSLHSGVVAKEVLRRGHAVMQSDPKGPVYLTLPRETLAESWDEADIKAFPESRYGPVASGGVEPAVAVRIAERLMAAKSPIAVTTYLGRNPEAVGVFDALARECGIRVFESSPTCLNIPRNSPCFGGFDVRAAVAAADVGMLLDVDVPWLPKYVPDNPALYWMQVDVDAVKKDFPMWGFATEERVQGDCATVLSQVLEIVRARSDAAFRARVAARIAGWDKENAERKARNSAAAAKTGPVGAITPDHLCAALNAQISADDVVINEAIRNTFPVLNQLERTKPGTYMALAGGGLGFGGGAALGVKLARPQHRVIHVVGDGSFHFGNPTAVYAVAQQYKLPTLTVVLDNGGWQAVKESVLRVYPDGQAKQVDEFHSLLSGEHRHFEQVAAAFGAHAEAVDDAAALPAAITRCIAALDKGQAAVLTVRVTPL
jgi:acetolactate synthase-1/2/3 large subunit